MWALCMQGEISSWDEVSGEMGFQFSQVDIKLLGNKVGWLWSYFPPCSPGSGAVAVYWRRPHSFACAGMGGAAQAQAQDLHLFLPRE